MFWKKLLQNVTTKVSEAFPVVLSQDRQMKMKNKEIPGQGSGCNN